MDITTLTVGPLQTNCYLLTHPETFQTIIIDPGEEADFISQQIIDKDLKPLLILLTHGHFDHVLGSLELKLNFNLPIALPSLDLSLYQQAPKSSFYWTKQSPPPLSPPNILIKNDYQLPQPFSHFTIIPTPGHTPGSISLYSKKDRLLFSGDTLFADGIGRTDFPYSSSLDLHSSLQTLLKLPPQTIVYPGHGSTTTIKQARRHLKDIL